MMTSVMRRDTSTIHILSQASLCGKIRFVVGSAWWSPRKCNLILSIDTCKPDSRTCTTSAKEHHQAEISSEENVVRPTSSELRIEWPPCFPDASTCSPLAVSANIFLPAAFSCEGACNLGWSSTLLRLWEVWGGLLSTAPWSFSLPARYYFLPAWEEHRKH